MNIQKNPQLPKMTICKIEQQACHTVFPLHLRYINQSRNALFLIQVHFEEAIDLYYIILILVERRPI